MSKFTVISIPVAFGDLNHDEMSKVIVASDHSIGKEYTARTCIDAMWAAGKGDRSRHVFELDLECGEFDYEKVGNTIFTLTNHPARQEEREASGYKGYSHSVGDILIVKTESGAIAAVFIDNIGCKVITLQDALSVVYHDALANKGNVHGYASMGWEFTAKHLFQDVD